MSEREKSLIQQVMAERRARERAKRAEKDREKEQTPPKSSTKTKIMDLTSPPSSTPPTSSSSSSFSSLWKSLAHTKEDADRQLALALAASTSSRSSSSSSSSSSLLSASSSSSNPSTPFLLSTPAQVQQYLLAHVYPSDQPHPDARQLFMLFDRVFFDDRLVAVEVRWSKRMTVCAGLCAYEGRGGLCRISLSESLLQFRSRKELVETLIHEMIHAFLFVTAGNTDRDGHGPNFRKHMQRINTAIGVNITVYHTFHDEVKHFKQHWWKCSGPCTKKKPFFGVVKRSMNRKPGPHDTWYADHERTCGGRFTKIKEPEGFKSMEQKQKEREERKKERALKKAEKERVKLEKKRKREEGKRAKHKSAYEMLSKKAGRDNVSSSGGRSSNDSKHEVGRRNTSGNERKNMFSGNSSGDSSGRSGDCIDPVYGKSDTTHHHREGHTSGFSNVHSSRSWSGSRSSSDDGNRNRNGHHNSKRSNGSSGGNSSGSGNGSGSGSKGKHDGSNGSEQWRKRKRSSATACEDSRDTRGQDDDDDVVDLTRYL